VKEQIKGSYCVLLNVPECQPSTVNAKTSFILNYSKALYINGTRRDDGADM